MADSKSKSSDDTKFKKVVQHFLKTPPRPHEKGSAKKATQKSTRKAKK